MNGLIERAIQSAKARIYKLEQSEKKNHTGSHQIKAENQMELQKVTVEALEKRIPKEPVEGKCLGVEIWQCPDCFAELYSGQPYCDECGKCIDWSVVE